MIKTLLLAAGMANFARRK
ncbi:MAG: MprA protease, GlyGly-CTERM protein-sorting domain-containing form [Chitinophaga sp.]